jgi:hypothetical protein
MEGRGSASVRDRSIGRQALVGGALGRSSELAAATLAATLRDRIAVVDKLVNNTRRLVDNGRQRPASTAPWPRRPEVGHDRVRRRTSGLQ